MTAAEIKALRQALGLTQLAFARRLGFTRDRADITVLRWEQGVRRPSAQSVMLMRWMVGKGVKTKRAA